MEAFLNQFENILDTVDRATKNGGDHLPDSEVYMFTVADVENIRRIIRESFAGGVKCVKTSGGKE